MNGVELYETLATAGCHLPLVLITGRNDITTRHLIDRVKAAEVLIKPFDDTAILEIVSRALPLSVQKGRDSH